MSAGLPEFDAADNGPQAGMGYPGAMPYGSGGGDSLVRIAWRGKWLIVLSVLAALAGAFLYLREATPVYQSTARILVEKPSPQSHSDAPVSVGSTLANYLATQATLMTSPEIIAAALRDPNLVARPTFADPNYVRALVGTLTAEAGKKADIIQITASSTYPNDAAQIVNAVVRAYTRWHEANRQVSTADLLKNLNAQLDTRYAELQAKRREQMLFEQRAPEVVENARGGVVSQTLDLLKQELAAARLAVVERDSYYQGLQRFAKEPETFRQYVYSYQAATAGAVKETERARLQMELQKVQLELQEAQVLGAAQRARMTMLQNRQSDLQKQIADFDTAFVQQHLALAKTLSADAHAREKQLAGLYEAESSKIRNLSEQDSQYAFLKSECEIMEKLCNSLLNQISQLDLSARLEGLKVHVLARAVPAPVPSSPQRARIFGIALMLGLMAGGGLSLLRNWWDQRLRSADEIAALLGAPVLGAIPSASRRVLRPGRKLRFAADSRESEACRAIRTALLCGTQRDQMRTILVTSPGSGEGKTLLVSNLGAAMAQVGQKTLILDADLRKPLAQRIFTTNGHSAGLVDVLGGTIELHAAIRATDIEGLYLLEGGQSTANPSELLTGPRFAALLAQLGGEYDRILIDSPPVGLVTDAQVLATLSGATLLVLRAERSSRVLTQRARDALLAVGVRIAGAVVNDVPKGDNRYGHVSGYGCYYAAAGPNGHHETRGESSVASPHPGPEMVQAMHTSLLPAPVPSSDAAPNGTPVQAGPPLEIKTTPPKKSGRRGTKNGRRTTEGLRLKDKTPIATEHPGTGLSEGAGLAADTPPSAGAWTVETANSPAPTSAEPAAAAEPQTPNSGPAPAKKRNGRNGIKSDLAGDTASPPAANAATPPPAGGETVRKEPPKDIDSPPDPRDPAEDWKEWLKGNQ